MPSGRNAIRDWYERENEEVQGAFDVVIEYLSQRERLEWVRPDFDQLSGKQREIGEIRFKANRVEYRVLGFFGPGRSDFCMLIGCHKKGKRYYPKDALETAVSRRKKVLEEGASCDVLDF